MSTMQIFFEELQKLQQGNFLTAPKRISAALKALTDDSAAFSILQLVSENFELVPAMEECFLSSPPALPKEDKKLIALVIGLLLKIDQKEISFQEMLMNVYGEEDDPYKSFCDAFIAPLSSAFTRVSAEELFEDISLDEEAIAQLRESVIPLMRSALEKLLTMPESPSFKELLCVYKGFFLAIRCKTPSEIRCLWIGLKNTAGVYGFYPTEFEQIEELLKSDGVTE